MISSLLRMLRSSVRIIAGEFKGRKVSVLPGRTLRPTSERVREALFSILGDQVQRATVADLFAGTGAVGLEALSRGAARVLFVDQNPECGTTIQQTLRQFNLSTPNRVLIEDVSLAIQNPILLGWRPFDVLFIDPPYQFPDIPQILTHIEKARMVGSNACVIYEHFHKTKPPRSIGEWTITRTARYGDTALTFYQSNLPIAHNRHQ